MRLFPLFFNVLVYQTWFYTFLYLNELSFTACAVFICLFIFYNHSLVFTRNHTTKKLKLKFNKKWRIMPFVVEKRISSLWVVLTFNYIYCKHSQTSKSRAFHHRLSHRRWVHRTDEGPCWDAILKVSSNISVLSSSEW